MPLASDDMKTAIALEMAIVPNIPPPRQSG
jgi:hypothetical protein